MNKILISLLFFFTFTALGQVNNFEDVDKIDLEKLEGDILLNDAMIAQERDEVTGVPLKSFSTKNDQGRYSFMYHLNSDIFQFDEISSFEVAYAHRYDWGWVEYSFVRTSAKIDQITEYNSAANSITEDLLLDTHTISEFGIGLGYRSKYIQHLIDAQSLFETIAASLEYVSFSDNTNDDTFTGIGLKADFGIHIRSSKNFHYGLKLGTHLASVEKAQTQDGQSNTERALLLRWITLGLDLSFYY